MICHMGRDTYITEAEQALIDAAREGQEIDLVAFAEDRTAKVRIRASVLRALMLRKNGWRVHPRGLRMKNAHVCEQLDLSHCQVSFPLIMRDCIFGDKGEWQAFAEQHAGDNWKSNAFYETWANAAVPLNFDRARLQFLQLDGSLLHGGLTAEGAHIASGLRLEKTEFSATCHMLGMKVGGQFGASGAKFNAKQGVSLNAQGAEISEDCFLDSAEFSATCHMSGVKIDGQLVANAAKFKAEKDYALNAQGAEISNGCFLEEAEFSTTCWLPGVNIGGQLSANAAKFKAEKDYALNAQGAEISGDCFLVGAEFSATCLIAGTKIRGQLAAKRAKFKAVKGYALNAQGAEISNSCFLDSAEFSATCYMLGVRISGQLSAQGATFKVKQDFALDVQGAEISEGCFLRKAEFSATCHMPGVRISGQLSAQGATFKAKQGRALNAEGAEIEKGIFFREKAAFTGEVCFVGARLGGLFMEGAQLKAHGAKHALDALRCVIDGDCWLKDGCTAKGAVRFDRAEVGGEFSLFGADLQMQGLKNAFSFVEGKAGRLILPGNKPPRGIVDLTRTRLGTLEDHESGWPEGGKMEHLVLDGLTYEHLRYPAGRAEDDGAGGAEEIVEARKKWLMRQKPDHLNAHYRPQPWTQLIRALRRDGHAEAAEEFEILRRRQERKALLATRPIQRALDWFLDWFSGYGYHPWRALCISAVAVLLFSFLWGVAMLGCVESGCRDESVFVRTKVAEYSRIPARGGQQATYPDFNPLGFSFDAFVPLFDFGYQDTWAVNTGWKPLPISSGNGSFITLGGLLYLVYVLEVILGAIMVTITVAGFTGLLRRRRDEEGE